MKNSNLNRDCIWEYLIKHYKKEEIKFLKKLMSAENLVNIDLKYRISRFSSIMRYNIYTILKMPLINIPLFINEKEPLIKIIAKFRLRIGR